MDDILDKMMELAERITSGGAFEHSNDAIKLADLVLKYRAAAQAELDQN